LEQCLEALDRLGQDPDRLRGRALVRLHRYAEALELLGRGSSAELLARLEAQEALGLFQEWDKELTAAAQLLGAQHPEVLRRRGRLALDAGRLEEAIAHFEATLQQDPSAAPALFGLGQALLRSGREEQGLAKLAEHRRLVALLDELEFAHRSLDLAPRHGPNWAALGDAQRRMGQAQQALLAYNRGLELTEGEQHITILLRAARVEEEDLLKPELALQRLEQALLKQPDPRLLVRASDVALRSGNRPVGAPDCPGKGPPRTQVSVNSPQRRPSPVLQQSARTTCLSYCQTLPQKERVTCQPDWPPPESNSVGEPKDAGRSFPTGVWSLLVFWALCSPWALLGCAGSEDPGATGARKGPSPPPSNGSVSATSTSADTPAPSAGPVLWFSDGTEGSGLDFVHAMGATPERHLPETMGGGGALVDVDNDGDLDVYCVQSGSMPLDLPGLEAAARDPKKRSQLRAGEPPNRLFLNSGRGQFKDHTGESGAAADRGYGQGVAVGDANGDGLQDFYVTNFGPDVFLAGAGGGRFVDQTLQSGLFDPRWTAGASFFDADLDGDLDLYVTGYVQIDVTKPQWCGRKEENYRSYCSPDEYAGLEDRFWKNDGQGRFELANQATGLIGTDGKGLDVLPVDIDLDGDLDLYVANDSVENRMWANQGDGSFKDATLLTQTGVDGNGLTEAGMGLVAGDMDDDLDFDLYVTNLDLESNTYYRNDGRWFSDATAQVGLDAPSRPYVGFGTVAEDFDLDGDLDYAVANGHIIHNIHLYYPERSWAQPFSLYENVGKGRFASRPEYLGELAKERFIGRGLYSGDVDGDGDSDLLMLQCGGPAKLLINQTPLDRPSIEVRGLTPGAYVRAVTSSGSTRLRLGGGPSYYGRSSDRAIFALGEALDLAATRVVGLGPKPVALREVPLEPASGDRPRRLFVPER
jgi:tetratricopeptide (TPR) repeat protein